MHLAAEVDVGGLGEKAERHFTLLTWHADSSATNQEWNPHYACLQQSNYCSAIKCVQKTPGQAGAFCTVE
jgi:hypothetical protein